MPARYSVETTADVSLSAATAKTVLSVVNAANALIRLIDWAVCGDGTSATAEPITVELCFCTEATAGTSTAQSLVQTGGPVRAAQCSGKRNFTAEPTVVTVAKRWLVHPQTGLSIPQPLGRELEQVTTADSMLLRCTAPAAVNVQSFMEVEEG